MFNKRKRKNINRGLQQYINEYESFFSEDITKMGLNTPKYFINLLENISKIYNKITSIEEFQNEKLILKDKINHYKYDKNDMWLPYYILTFSVTATFITYLYNKNQMWIMLILMAGGSFILTVQNKKLQESDKECLCFYLICLEILLNKKIYNIVEGEVAATVENNTNDNIEKISKGLSELKQFILKQKLVDKDIEKIKDFLGVK